MIDVSSPGGGPTSVPTGLPEDDGAPRRLPGRLPVLPLRDTVTFPDLVLPLAIGQERSVALVNEVLGGDRMLAMVASRDPESETPAPGDLRSVGVAGVVARMLRVPDGTLRVLMQGQQRIRIDGWAQEEPYLVAEVSELPDVLHDGPEMVALVRNLQTTFSQVIDQVPQLPDELKLAVANLDDPSALCHLIAGALNIGTEEKQSLLEELDVVARLRRLAGLLAHELEVITLGTKIQTQVQSELTQAQREYFLRQQLKAIQDELGEGDDQAAEVEELRERLEAVALPAEARRAADRELGRLERTPPAGAEHGVIRTYLEWILDLPWGTSTEDDLDLGHARAVLDEDHYDIERVKDRILEFLAVRSLQPDARGTILLLAGPPGVGKTSLGRSIARALGRRFERIAVGGVRDEAEIRGHRRTYVGAVPGVVIRALRDAGADNPLLMIDEIDKLGGDFRGDPASAMLEVLDPEQNTSFRDHYLDLPFDLSKVMFICTANALDSIPGPLLDRMELIQLAGYTEEEKLQIAKRYLVPRQVERNGLTRGRISFADSALRVIVSEYTREAGVRSLEREIGAVCRKIARRVAEGDAPRRVAISGARVRELLGPPRFRSDTRRRTARAGVATGLAWTPVGGDVLFVEATAMSGTGRLTLTGQLGDVMRESAQAALSYVRANRSELVPELEEAFFAEHDLHVHVPAGAIPKDGPSAGITMATALVSLLTDRPVRSDVAMTGEITLTGQVLPIGGLKEKALAAQRHGIRQVIAPVDNRVDEPELPPHLRERIALHWASDLADVLAVALGPRRRRARPSANRGAEAAVSG